MKSRHSADDHPAGDEEDIAEMLRRADEMPHGPEQIALVDCAVREADRRGTPEESYLARLELISAATFGGANEKALVAFSWCLAHFDKLSEPDFYDQYRMMWRYKWIISHLCEFPNVSLEKIRQFIDDFERRLDAYGLGTRPALLARARTALDTGRIAESVEYLAQWRCKPASIIDDCSACERNWQVTLFTARRRFAQAIKFAAPLLDGRLTCATVPQVTYSNLLRPLFLLNRVDEARKMQVMNIRQISGQADFLNSIHRHLLFLTAVGEQEKALRLCVKHLPLAVATFSLDVQMEFYTATAAVLRSLKQTGRKRQIRLPASLPCVAPDHRYSPPELAGWFQGQAEQLADRFDQRNGNDHWRNWIASTFKWVGV